MKQLHLIPLLTESKRLTYCQGCGATSRIEYRNVRGFPKKLNPLGWAKIKGDWLCDTCIEKRMKGIP